jgi:DNA-directed RNA polymerase subunit RPC12/RpoP
MYLCLACSKEIDPKDPRISDTSHPFHGGCPECGHRGIPADLTEKVSVSITWHELRVLTIWAERWASHCKDTPNMLPTVYGIADRLQMQHMDKPGLTFLSELSDLRGTGFGNIEQNVIREEPE